MNEPDFDTGHPPTSIFVHRAVMPGWMRMTASPCRKCTLMFVGYCACGIRRFPSAYRQHELLTAATWLAAKGRLREAEYLLDPAWKHPRWAE